MIYLKVILILLFLNSKSYAEDSMVLLGYSEISDCKYSSKEDNCRIDENGQKHCAIKQDERCDGK